MTGRGEIESRRAAVVNLCHAHGVARLSVFGSAMRDDFDPRRSDIDLRVEFLPDHAQPWAGEYFELKQELERLFEREVDLISAAPFANPYIAATVEQDEELLYAA